MEFRKKAIAALLTSSVAAGSGCFSTPDYRGAGGVRYSNGSFQRYPVGAVGDARSTNASPEAFLSYLQRSDTRYSTMTPQESARMAAEIRLMQEQTALIQQQSQALEDMRWQQAGQSFLDVANTFKRGFGELGGSFQGAFNQVSPTLSRINAGAFSAHQLQLLNQYQVWQQQGIRP